MSDATVTHRGTKRKRQAPIQPVNPTAKLPGKLHHALREVKKSAKKARTFETQKLVKKLKALRNLDKNATQIVELESHLEILKHLDLDDFATGALRNKLKKDRVLSSNSFVDSFVTEGLSSSKADINATSVEGKVRNKLMSSKTFSLDMTSLINGLRKILQPSDDDDDDDDSEEDEGDMEAEAEHDQPSRINRGDKVSSEEEEGDKSDSSDEEAEHKTTEEDEAGWESGSISPHPGPEDDIDDSDDLQAHSAGEDSSEDDLHDEISDSESSDVAVNLPQKRSDKHASSSTFLPSLSVGFIRGDSDSDEFSDSESKLVDGVRKNRRGQRARRAIWEKKYGKGAKHIQKQKELEKQKQKSDKDKRRGNSKSVNERRRPPPPRTFPPKFEPPTTRDSGYASRTKAIPSADEPPLPPAKRIRREDRPLHPSWEAKKKLKESQKVAIVPAQGKKIVF